MAYKVGSTHEIRCDKCNEYTEQVVKKVTKRRELLWMDGGGGEYETRYMYISECPCGELNSSEGRSV